MQTFVIVSALIATAFAAPSVTLLSAVPTVIAAPGPVLSQHHSQDSLGQYAYGYNGGSSAKEELRTLDGVTRGTYSYIDANNILQTVEYTADAVNGFRAAATNLPRAPLAEVAVGPEPVHDTPEVAAAKIEHTRAFNEAALRAAATPEVPVAAPVQDTPEVAAAKIEHTRLFNEAALRATAAPVVAETPASIVAVRSWPSFSYAINAPTWLNAPLIRAAVAAPIQLAPNGVVLDTPEVVAARTEHLRLVEEQKERIARAHQ